FYPAYNDWVTGASLFDRETGAGITPSAGFYNTERKVSAVDGYFSGAFELFGLRHEVMGGLNYNKREYVNAGSYVMGFPGSTTWDPFSSYLNWTGDISEPNWGDMLQQSRGTITQKAGYAAARLSLAEPLKLIVGARYSDWSLDGIEGTVVSKFSHKVTTPYAGLVFDINDTWSTYASYTEIFQPQTLRNQQGDYLDPVDGKSYEVGVKGAWFDNRLNASAAVFRIEQDNVGQATNIPVQGTLNEFAYIGARGTVSRGFELELNGELAPGWNATFGASRYVAKDAEGTDINTRLPQTTIKLFTSFTPQSLDALTFGGGANWQNRIYYPVPAYGQIEQGGYALVSAFVRYRIAPQFSVQANLNNLLDKKYLSQVNG
ncbi:MAG: TonB-dependent receptor domain-containing protein, partial [Pseudomonas sp.]